MNKYTLLAHVVTVVLAASYFCSLIGRLYYIDRQLAEIKEELSDKALAMIADTRKGIVKKWRYCVLFTVFYVGCSLLSLL